MAVPYLHVRICKYPKYYFNEELSQKNNFNKNSIINNFIN